MTITSFSDDMRQRGLTPGSRTLEFRTIPAGARLGRILYVSPSEPVLSVKRLRLADGEPMAVELLHVPESLFPGPHGRGPRGELVLRPAGEPVRDRDRRRHPDGRADGNERGGVEGARRPAPLAGAPVRARDARRGRRDRRVHELDLPRRPLPARLRARRRRPPGDPDRPRVPRARRASLTSGTVPPQANRRSTRLFVRAKRLSPTTWQYWY